MDQHLDVTFPDFPTPSHAVYASHSRTIHRCLRRPARAA